MVYYFIYSKSNREKVHRFKDYEDYLGKISKIRFNPRNPWTKKNSSNQFLIPWILLYCKLQQNPNLGSIRPPLKLKLTRLFHNFCTSTGAPIVAHCCSTRLNAAPNRMSFVRFVVKYFCFRFFYNLLRLSEKNIRKYSFF